MKICFITCLFANSYSEVDKPVKFNKNSNYDYYLFTNLSKDDFNTSWDVVNISDTFNNTNIDSNIIKSRYPKFMSWKLLKDVLNKEYDVIFYCDAQYTPRDNVDWESCAKRVIDHPSGIMQQQHIRDAYLETIEIFKEKKDSNVNCNKTLKFLTSNKFPKNFPMQTNTTFAYNPNNKLLINALSDFWDKYSKYEISHRDQPIWSYYQYKHNITPLQFDVDNRNGTWFDTERMVHALFVRTAKLGFNNHTYV